MTPTPYAPVSPAERLQTLDVLRGAALLGILLMNVLLFGMPEAAYANLNLWGGRDGANLAAFLVQWIFFEGKMRALFSIMFGAGIVMFLERAVRRQDSVQAADLFVRRMLWLLVIGALHAWLIWYGDIVYAYAMCGLMLFPARVLKPRTLFIAAAIALAALTAGYAAEGYSRLRSRQAAMDARAAQARGMALTQEQQDAVAAWDEKWNDAVPPRQELQEEVDNYRSGYIGAFKQRAEIVLGIHWLPLYFPVLADFWALMLIGMGLYKLGVLQGEWPTRAYVRLAAAGYAIAVPLNAASAYGMIAFDFDPVASVFVNLPHQAGRVAMALAHMAVIVIVVKQGWAAWLTRRLAAVGQTALSNYIGTSVLCSLIFYSPGLALMGQLERYQLYFVVVAVWAVNLAWSSWWVARYHFGPLEWCWRSLTYWRRQPMRRADEVLRAHAIV